MEIETEDGSSLIITGTFEEWKKYGITDYQLQRYLMQIKDGVKLIETSTKKGQKKGIKKINTAIERLEKCCTRNIISGTASYESESRIKQENKSNEQEITE